MGKKLAIRGHATRGKEVIELLQMMGGTNPFSKNDGMVIGNKTTNCYYISEDTASKYISWDYIGPEEIDKYEIFTLEEFLDKFPFKVGDFVRIPEYESEVRILKMKWCPLSEHIEYLVCPNDEEEWFTADELLEDNDNPTKTRDCKKCGLHFGSVRCFDKDCPHNTPKSYAVGLKDGKVIDCIANKKTDMNKNNREEINMTKETIIPTPDITADVTDKNNCGIQCPDGYEFYDENGNLIGNKVMMRPKKPKYPTSYNDCCDILGFKNRNKTEQFVNSCDLYDAELMTKLSMLKVCRDAYWKIAGEEMGLGKPWEPDWDNLSTNHEFIKINKGCFTYSSRVLVFPTEEMRDIFYENFKDLIEECKELL